MSQQPQSHSLALLYFFLWGFVKQKVYFLPLPANVDLQAGITGTLAEVMLEMLCCTWEEIHFRWDTCYAASESHTEL
jgi:hypothetical protein